MKRTDRSVRVVAAAYFFSAGAFAFVAQTLIFRAHHLLHQGSDLAIGLFFSSWLAWVAVGAGAARPALRRVGPGPLTVLLLISWLPLAILELWLFAAGRELLGPASWETLAPGRLLVLTALGNAPVSAVTGAVFVAGSALVAGERQVTANYAAEALGSFAGGAGATLLLQAGVSGPGILSLAAMLLALGALGIAISRGRPAAVAMAAGLGIAVGAAHLAGVPDRLRGALDRARWHAVLPRAERITSCDTPYEHVAVGRMAGQTLIVRDGELRASTPDPSGYGMTAAILMTQLERAAGARLLLVGEGPAGLLRSLLAWRPAELVWLDADPAATRCIRPHLPAPDRAALGDHRVQVLAGDPRRAVHELARTRPGGFDLVAVLSGDPRGARDNRLHTEEFDRDARALLRPGGLLALRVGSEANYLGEAVAGYGAVLLATLRASFERVLVGPGQEQWFFAGGTASSATLEADRLEARFGAGAPAEAPVSAERLAILWPPERVAAVRARLAAVAATEGPNTDSHPSAWFLALIWHARALGSGLGRWLQAARSGGPVLLLIPVVILVLLRLHYVSPGRAPAAVARFDATVLVALAGAFGMATAVILMHAFEAEIGAIFVHVGLVGGLFTAGLALGSQAGRMLLARSIVAVERLQRLAVVAIGAFCLGLAQVPGWLRGCSPDPAMLAFGGLFVAAGTVAGLPLAAAEAASGIGGRGRADRTRVALRLEAADHAGGALAAALVGTLAVPLAGLSGACYLVAGWAAAVGLLWVHRELRARGWERRPPLAWLRRRGRRRSFRQAGLLYGLVGVTASIVAMASVVRGRLDRPVVRIARRDLAALRLAGGIGEHDRPFPHATWTQPGRPPSVAAAASMALAPDVRGYAGPLNLLVAVDATAHLARLRVLQSRETPSYVHGMGAWLRGLEGRPIDPPLRLRPLAAIGPRRPFEVDAITGATITSEALIEAIDRSTRPLATEILGLPAPGRLERGSPWRRWLHPAALYLVAALAAAVWAARRAGARQRLVLLAVNAVLGGLVLDAQLSLVDIGRLVHLDPPSLARPLALILLWANLGLAAFFGPIYCAHACPFGAAQELLGAAGRPGRLHPALEDRARLLKYVVLAAVVSAFALGGGDEVFAFDPLRSGLGRHATGPALVLVLLVGLASLVLFRPWCRYLCPVGAALLLGNHLRLGRRWLRPRSYSACDLGVDGDHDIDCLQCDRCVHGTTLPVRPVPTREAP